MRSIFVIAFGFVYFSTLFLFKNAQLSNATDYLAATPSPVVLAKSTLTPAFFIPSPSPTPSPTPTPAPTPTSVAAPTVWVAPTPTPDVWSPADIEPVFARFAGQYGVDKNELERIANCESHFNPNARNGDYLGLFQFSTITWISSRNAIGRDPSPDLRANVEESIQTAAYLHSVRGSSPWPNCLR